MDVDFGYSEVVIENITATLDEKVGGIVYNIVTKPLQVRHNEQSGKEEILFHSYLDYKKYYVEVENVLNLHDPKIHKYPKAIQIMHQEFMETGQVSEPARIMLQVKKPQ